jgi:hypothetical protein
LKIFKIQSGKATTTKEVLKELVKKIRNAGLKESDESKE